MNPEGFVDRVKNLQITGKGCGPMEGMNIAVFASLEGCLPDEYFPKSCRHCGTWFDSAAEAHELYCPRCTMTKPGNDVPEEEE